MSAVAGWIIATGVYAGGLVLGRELSPRVVIGIALAVAAILVAAADKIAILLARQVGKLVVDIDEFESLYEEPEYDNDPEVSYLLGVFINNVISRVIPGARVILQDNNGRVIFDPSVDVLGQERERNPTSVQGMRPIRAIHYHGNIIGIVMDPEAFNPLAEAIRRGDGEKVVFQHEDEIVVLYDIVKKAYLAKYPESSNEMAAYIAYKTILTLAKEDVIEAPPHLLNILPFENQEIRARIIEQVREEGII